VTLESWESFYATQAPVLGGTVALGNQLEQQAGGTSSLMSTINSMFNWTPETVYNPVTSANPYASALPEIVMPNTTVNHGISAPTSVQTPTLDPLWADNTSYASQNGGTNLGSILGAFLAANEPPPVSTEGMNEAQRAIAGLPEPSQGWEATEAPEAILGRAALDVAGSDIPLYSDLARAARPLVGEGLEFLGDRVAPAVLPGVADINRLLSLAGLPSAGEIAGAVGEAVVPVTLGDVALEATPIGLAGDVARGVRRLSAPGLGAVDDLASLPGAASRAAARKFPESPGVAGDVANLQRGIVGAADFQPGNTFATPHRPRMYGGQSQADVAAANANLGNEPLGGLRPDTGRIFREAMPVNDEMRAVGEGMAFDPKALGIPDEPVVVSRWSEIAQEPKGKFAEWGKLDAQREVLDVLKANPNDAAQAFDDVGWLLSRQPGAGVRNKAHLEELERIHDVMSNETFDGFNWAVMRQADEALGEVPAGIAPSSLAPVQAAGGPPDVPGAPGAVTGPGDTSPLQKLTQAIRNAGKVTPEQRAMFAQQRAQRTARGASALERGQGPEAFGRARGALAGGFARPDFAVPTITPEDTTQLLETIRTSPLQFYEKINAEQALQDLFSGRIPEPSRLNALRKAFAEEGKFLVQAVTDKRGLGAKVWDEIVGVLGAPQALKASFDLSAPFRQGQMLGWSNPAEWKRAWRPMIKAFGSEQGLADSARYIDNSPWMRATGDRAGFGFEEVGGKIYDPNSLTDALERPGGFAGLNRSHVSQFIQSIPGVDASQRAYSTFLNEQGLRVYEKTAQAMWDAGVRDIAQYEALAKVINHARGYGDFTVGQLARGVNAFFSGRNFVARFQTLIDPILQPGSLLEPSARQLAAKNLAAMAAGDLTTLGLLGAMGTATGLWSVEMDPRSTDWGKLRIGNTRIDPWAGFSPMVRMAARIATGDLKSAGGDIYPSNLRDEVLKFFRNKQAPAAALIVDALVGENAIGEPFDLNAARVADMFVPFIAGDVVEALLGDRAFSSLGTPGYLASVPFGAVGFGTLDYPPAAAEQLNNALKNVPESERTNLDGKVVTSWRELSAAQKNAITAKYPEIAAITEARNEASDSAFGAISQAQTEARTAAWANFQATGNGADYRAALTDAANEARIRFDQESKGQDPAAYSPDQKLMQAYFNKMDEAGKDYELRDRLDAEFRATLSPAALDALDANLQTSADPNYAKLKAARTYLTEAYWDKRDEQYLELVKTAAPGSPASKYATYNDLSKAAEDRASPDYAMAQKLKGAIDGRLSDQSAALRYQDPKADALLYIYGYVDTVISPTAQAMVIAWAKENGVTMTTPPLRSSR